MKSKALAVQSILGMTENLANECQLFGHSLKFATRFLSSLLLINLSPLSQVRRRDASSPHAKVPRRRTCR